MHAINHAAVGSIIALTTKQPAIALPASFVSHFVLDALPHYGIAGDEGYAELFKHRPTIFMVLVDAVGLAILIYLIRAEAWYVAGSAFLAVSPDFAWIYRYFWYERQGKKPSSSWLTRFHQKIQWHERPGGVFIEIPLATALLVVVRSLVR